MPPKPKITREMIVEAAFELVRTGGVESINARSVSQRLNCSTQPVLYCFDSMDEVKRAVYARADAFHTDYLTQACASPGNVLLSIGLRYIRFAREEPRLFRFLFQSGYATGHSVVEMIEADELMPVLSAMQAAMGMTLAQTRHVFLTIALFAHGYACLLANNGMAYDEDVIAAHLTRAYRGAVLELEEEEHEKAAGKE